MSQAATEITGLRVLFEGVPDGIIQSINEIESELDSAESNIIESANRIENAVADSAKKQAQSVKESAKAQQSIANEIQQSLRDQGDEYISTAGAAETATKRTATTMNDLGEVVDRRTEGFRKLTGALGGAVGAVTGLIGVGTVLIGVIAGIGRAMVEKAKRIGEANMQYADMRDEINELLRMDPPSVFRDIRDEVEGMRDAVWDANYSLERKLELMDKLDEYQGKLETKVIREREEQEKLNTAREKATASKALREMAQTLRVSAITREDLRAQAEYFRVLGEIEKLEKSGGSGPGLDEAKRAAKELYEQRLRQIWELADAELIADKEREQRAEEAHRKELERIAERERRTIEANNRILSTAATNIQQTFGEETTRLLTTIIKKVDQAGRRASRASR